MLSSTLLALTIEGMDAEEREEALQELEQHLDRKTLDFLRRRALQKLNENSNRERVTKVSEEAPSTIPDAVTGVLNSTKASLGPVENEKVAWMKSAEDKTIDSEDFVKDVRSEAEEAMK